CNTADCGQIYFNPDTGVFSNDLANGQKTIFSRVVVVKKVAGTDDIKKVSSTVSWYNQVIPKSVTIDRYIYNLNIIP
ncbi:hypothetical protein ACI3QN_13950, partial [Propionibacterium freudenreichii]|uniref:hypothetical protein n=1 Tax=Propionibacterium freudenreichii TaxID=1744 RepID=UPI00385424BE